MKVAVWIAAGALVAAAGGLYAYSRFIEADSRRIYKQIYGTSRGSTARRPTPRRAKLPRAKPQPTPPRKLPVERPPKAPHPDYPTAKRAKTSKLFVLEEPDRGPQLLEVKIPAHDKLTYHDHCVLTYDRVACSRRRGKRAANGRVVWVVAHSEGKIVWAALQVGKRVDFRYVFVRDGKRGRLSAIAFIDGHGIVAWSRHFDAVGEVYTSRKRSGANELDGCGKIKLTHDKRGRVIASSCLQWSGAPMLDEDGVFRRRYRRDARGFLRETFYDGLDGKPTASHAGAYRVTKRRDAAGRETACVYRDASGLATMSSHSGCYGYSYRYDRRGLYVGRTCLDGEGRRAGGAGGLAHVAYGYNAAGCRIWEQRDYATPSSAYRLYRREYTVNAHCQRVRTVCYDKQHHRARCGPGEPVETYATYDAAGNKTAEQHFDARGRPGRDPLYNVFEVRYGYDARGNNIRLACYAPKGVPTPCGSTGFHEGRSTYDAAGHLVSQRFYDTSGRRAANLSTYERRYKYDNYDHLAATLNLGLDGKLTSSLGESKRRYIYDAGHRMFGMLMYDRFGRPARYRGCIVGRTCPRGAWHAVRVVRRLDGSVVSNLFFDHEGQLIHTVDCGKNRCWR